MASYSEPLTSLGKGDSLNQQVLSAFPLCQLSEEDLSQNPRFCKLLATLSQHVDPTGLSVNLQKELEKTERELRTQRVVWLHSECLHRLLQEMIQEHGIKNNQSPAPPEEDKFYRTMEQNLLVMKCIRQLDVSANNDTNQLSILGLSAKDVLNFMPAEKDVLRMKKRLPMELEKHLKNKCFSLLAYYQPDSENESEGLKRVKLSHLPELLEGERKKAENLREKNREKTLLLQQQTHAYLTELLGCIHILQSLILEHRLKIQTELDRKKLEYFEAKCEIGIQKLRTEMLEIQLDTYTAGKISAHRKLREKLDAELEATQAEKQSVESKLASFEILGQEFEVLAEEYLRIRQEIDAKRWALTEFSQHNS
ncbi:HAUS augmin-like complex subunit 4 [Denticeps clupeoides]|uniref:HAUS augmin-like complex subunit 4 n=1 Tax=Denticeps clupeoides TaxID=299321 RepID=UPI0010A3E9BD|nr:HAUS augmin-like complex subunit 4 [Denticeps clupeoides]